MKMRSRLGPICACLLAAAVGLAHGGGEQNLIELSTELDAALEWDMLSATAVISRDGDRISFRVGSPWLVVNQRTRHAMEPATRRDGGVYLSASAADRIRETLEGLSERRWRVGVIMVDPGHGGPDPGTMSAGTKDGPAVLEKDVVLATSVQLAALLRAEFPDKRVLMTRSDDSSVTLEERTEAANRIELGPSEAMIYVSVHANWGFDTRAKGYEVWVFPSKERRAVLDESAVSPDLKEIWPILNSMREDEFNVQSNLLARSILDAIQGEVGSATTNRGSKTESWAVVREARMPAVLVELGFLSNPEEARLLADPAYQRRLARGIGSGVAAFVQRFEAALGRTD
jgi:N-acetylmuramoyl-L-alanine amidase